MNPSIDLIVLVVAVGLLALVFRAAARTRSPVRRVIFVALATLMMAIMLWNLRVHGGFHAV